MANTGAIDALMEYSLDNNEMNAVKILLSLDPKNNGSTDAECWEAVTSKKKRKPYVPCTDLFKNMQGSLLAEPKSVPDQSPPQSPEEKRSGLNDSENSEDPKNQESPEGPEGPATSAVPEEPTCLPVGYQWGDSEMDLPEGPDCPITFGAPLENQDDLEVQRDQGSTETPEVKGDLDDSGELSDDEDKLSEYSRELEMFLSTVHKSEFWEEHELASLLVTDKHNLWELTPTQMYMLCIQILAGTVTFPFVLDVPEGVSETLVQLDFIQWYIMSLPGAPQYPPLSSTEGKEYFELNVFQQYHRTSLEELVQAYFEMYMKRNMFQRFPNGIYPPNTWEVTAPIAVMNPTQMIPPAVNKRHCVPFSLKDPVKNAPNNSNKTFYYEVKYNEIGQPPELYCVKTEDRAKPAETTDSQETKEVVQEDSYEKAQSTVSDESLEGSTEDSTDGVAAAVGSRSQESQESQGSQGSQESQDELQTDFQGSPTQEQPVNLPQFEIPQLPFQPPHGSQMPPAVPPPIPGYLYYGPPPMHLPYHQAGANVQDSPSAPGLLGAYPIEYHQQGHQGQDRGQDRGQYQPYYQPYYQGPPGHYPGHYSGQNWWGEQDQHRSQHRSQHYQNRQHRPVYQRQYGYDPQNPNNAHYGYCDYQEEQRTVGPQRVQERDQCVTSSQVAQTVQPHDQGPSQGQPPQKHQGDQSQDSRQNRSYAQAVSSGKKKVTYADKSKSVNE